jgi:hypothetical protein
MPQRPGTTNVANKAARRPSLLNFGIAGASRRAYSTLSAGASAVAFLADRVNRTRRSSQASLPLVGEGEKSKQPSP